MIGLFKPPHTHMLKRLPNEARLESAAVEAYVNTNTRNLKQVRTNLIKAFVLSVWANNSYAAGKFRLSEDDARYIKNLGLVSSGKLNSSEFQKAEEIIDELMKRDVIPSPNKSTDFEPEKLIVGPAQQWTSSNPIAGDIPDEVISKVGDISALTITKLFLLSGMAHEKTNANVDLDWCKFISGYILANSDILIQAVGGEAGSFDSRNLTLVVLDTLFNKPTSNELCDYAYGQVKNSNQNNHFSLGIEAGVSDGNDSLNKNGNGSKNLLEGLKNYT